MNKIDKIFIALIVIEAIISVVSFQFKVEYSNPCVTPDFFHPFGREMKEGVGCYTVIAIGPNPIFILSTDLLILTTITYMFYLIAKKLKRKR